MGRSGKTAGLSLLVAACLAVAAAAEEGEYKVEKAPEWSAEGGMFGWACSEEGGPNQECAFVETASSGVAPADSNTSTGTVAVRPIVLESMGRIRDSQAAHDVPV